MPDSNGTPTLIEVVDAAMEKASKRMRVHLPGTVEEVHMDADGNAVSVDVRVDVGEYRLSGGREVPDLDALLPNVPIEWMGAGGACLTFPIQRGDMGLLLFMDKGLDEWKSNASGQVVARAKRRHDLTDAVFAPGLHRLAAPWKGARTDAVTLGYEAGAGGAEPMRIHVTPDGIALGKKDPAYAVALAEKLETELAKLRTALTNWVPVASDGGAALKTALTAQGVTTPSWGTGLGSTHVKVDE